MTNSLIFLLAVSLVVLVTTPASLKHQIRQEIDSALVNFTCSCACKDAADRLDILLQRLDILHPRGYSAADSATSCAAILRDYPTSVSGYYWVSNATGHPHSVYCDMTRSCGGVTGGWMRVAYLDMTNCTHQCPSSLHQRNDSGTRSCAVKSDLRNSCSSVYYTSHGLHYSRVCGKIRGYHVNTLNGFIARSINDIYVEGVSLTYGVASRNHIWSFAAESFQPDCRTPQAFVGNNYFCDNQYIGSTINLNNSLWDGEGCGSFIPCSFNNPPWFYRQLPSSTTEDIEMRLCRDQDRHNEDITVDQVEIYIHV